MREFVEKSFAHIKVEIAWEGAADQEIGRDKATGKIRVRVDPKVYILTRASCIHTRIYIFILTHILTCIFSLVYIHSYTQSYVYTHSHMYTHSHIYSHLCSSPASVLSSHGG